MPTPASLIVSGVQWQRVQLAVLATPFAVHMQAANAVMTHALAICARTTPVLFQRLLVQGSHAHQENCQNSASNRSSVVWLRLNTLPRTFPSHTSYPAWRGWRQRKRGDLQSRAYGFTHTQLSVAQAQGCRMWCGTASSRRELQPHRCAWPATAGLLAASHLRRPGSWAGSWLAHSAQSRCWSPAGRAGCAPLACWLCCDDDLAAAHGVPAAVPARRWAGAGATGGAVSWLARAGCAASWGSRMHAGAGVAGALPCHVGF